MNKKVQGFENKREKRTSRNSYSYTRKWDVYKRKGRKKKRPRPLKGTRKPPETPKHPSWLCPDKTKNLKSASGEAAKPGQKPKKAGKQSFKKKTGEENQNWGMDFEPGQQDISLRDECLEKKKDNGLGVGSKEWGG